MIENRKSIDKKTEKTQVTNIRNKRRYIITDTMNIKRIIKIL